MLRLIPAFLHWVEKLAACDQETFGFEESNQAPSSGLVANFGSEAGQGRAGQGGLTSLTEEAGMGWHPAQ